MRSRLVVVASFASLVIGDADAADGPAETEVVLEADEIDSSTVEIGALAVVVYGQEERQPTSGEWAKLDTVRGYIKAVDRQGLLLSLKGWPQRIALDRIQTLTLVPPQRSASRDTTRIQAILDTLSARMRKGNYTDTSERIGRKLGSGMQSGLLCILPSALLLGSILAEKANCPLGEILCGLESSILGGYIGYVVGVPIGVSALDRHDYFRSLAFSLSGSFLGAGIGLVLIQRYEFLGPFLVISPPAMATLASEWFLNPPEVSQAHRFSVGLVPNPKGHLSAVATLRF